MSEDNEKQKRQHPTPAPRLDEMRIVYKDKPILRNAGFWVSVIGMITGFLFFLLCYYCEIIL